MQATPALFGVAELYGQITVADAIAEAHAEQRAQIIAAAEQVEAEAREDAARMDVVRAYIARGLSSGAEARISAALTSCAATAADAPVGAGAVENVGVDVEALRLTPRMREMLLDPDAGPWHPQTRRGAVDRGLTVDVETLRLTPFGERVRAALLAG